MLGDGPVHVQVANASGAAVVIQVHGDLYLSDPSLAPLWLPGETKPGECPFPGMNAFGPGQAKSFFGRQQLTGILLAALDEAAAKNSPVLVVGPSGSGKSSLLGAGLLAAFGEGRFPVSGSPSWPQIMITPGAQPLRTLRDALATCAQAQDGTADRTAIVVDQLEEIFTACKDERERSGFLHMIAELAGCGTAVVVLGLRADFYSQAMAYPVLGAAMQSHQVVVGAMTAAEVREAILCPARAAGLRVDEGLVERLLRDLGVNETGGYEPGRLPLLAHALRTTWQFRDGDRLTVAGYTATGGIGGAIAKSADDVYNRLDEAGKRAARQLFLALVRIGEIAADADDEGTPDTRRRVSAQSLSALGGDQVITRVVLDAFIAERLLTSGGKTVEITHETLLRHWPLLARWIGEDRSGHLIRQGLEDAAARREQGLGELYSGAPLAVAQQWAAAGPGRQDELSPPARAFLAASSRSQRRRARLRKQVMAALAALALTASVTSVIAYQQRAAAIHQRDVAAQQRQAAAAQALLARAGLLRTSQIGWSLLLGIASMRVSSSEQARSALISTLIGSHSPMTLPGDGTTALAVAFSPDGRELFTGYHQVGYLWQVRPGGPRRLGTLPVNAWGAAFSPDGRLLATVGADGRTMVWDMAHPGRLLALMPSDGGYVTSVAFSPDGRRLLTGAWDDQDPDRDAALLWDVTAAGKLRLAAVLRIAGSGPVHAVAFSRDGRIAYTGDDDGTVGIWDLARADRIGVLRAHRNTVYAVAVSPDGRTLLTGSADQTAALWDLTDPARPALLSTLTGHRGGVRAVAFSPDGTTVATGGLDNTAILWRVTNRSRPVRLDTLSGDSQGLWALAFSPGGKTLVTSSFDGSVIVWDVADSAQPAELSTLPAQVTGPPPLAYRPDGRVLASGGPGWDATLWDVTDPRLPRRLSTLAGHQATIFTLAFRPDGQVLATASDDGSVLLWNVAHPAAPAALARIGIGTGSGALGFTRDGHTLAVGDDSGQVTLWDVADPARPRLLSRIPVAASDIRVAAFSPDGRTLVTGSRDASIQTWDVSDPAQPSELARFTDHYSVYAGEFGPDGHTLALAEEGRKATLWDLRDPAAPRRLATLPGQSSSVFTAEFSPDGLLLATGGLDKTVIIWDITDLRQPSELIQRSGFPGSIGLSPFSPDGRTLAISSGGTPSLWDVSDLEQIVAQPVRAACAITGHGLTPEQWRAAGIGFPYQPTC